MKTAFVCNTPYQLMNVINIFINNVENTRTNSDLYIVNRFQNANKMMKKIQDAGLFSKIYFVDIKRRNRQALISLCS